MAVARWRSRSYLSPPMSLEYQTIIYALTSLVDEHFENIGEVIGAGKKRKKRTGGYQDHSRRIEMILEYTERGGGDVSP